MGNRTKRPPGRPKPQASRPSVFFIVALAIGLALLVWMFSQSAGSPAQPKTTSQLEMSKGALT
jgi:hypothetical protein